MLINKEDLIDLSSHFPDTLSMSPSHQESEG